MAGNRALDDGDILGLRAPKAKRNCGDKTRSSDESGVEDAMIEEKTPVQEGPFEGIDTALMTDHQLEDLLHLMSTSIHLPSVGNIMSEAGCPRRGSKGVMPKMVSEACKIYIRELIQMSIEGRVDFVSGDAMFAKRYNL